MTITRYVDVVNTEKYQLDVDDDLVFCINKSITENSKKPFEAVTLEDVCNCWKQNGSFTRGEEVLHLGSWRPRLEDYINGYIDDEIWNNYVDVVDSEYGPHNDEVTE